MTKFAEHIQTLKRIHKAETLDALAIKIKRLDGEIRNKYYYGDLNEEQRRSIDAVLDSYSTDLEIIKKYRQEKLKKLNKRGSLF
ncbi:hypothetical protein M3611_26740 [Priestia megaterium]|uniref:hypothetical protein n=1 Tax=Priestia megaterium TaxID=1404 RepID=UPI00203B5352|nr:hypothetical protein [Priestia megaterium]MCM3155593.1 hypothetical protein [Priestia megaterium]